MEEVDASREQLAGALADAGFAASTAEAQRGAAGGVAAVHQAALVRAIVVASLYPNLLQAREPDTKYMSTAAGAVASANDDSRLVKYYLAPKGGRAFLHPSSSLFGATGFECPWLVYGSKQIIARPGEPSPRVSVRNVTAASAYSLLLFGGDYSVQHAAQTVTIDGVVKLGVPPAVAALVRELRAALDAHLLKKLEDPAVDGGALVDAVIGLIAKTKV